MTTPTSDYVMVPREPTGAMIDAGNDAAFANGRSMVIEDWSAMIAARPAISDEIREKIARAICRAGITGPPTHLDAQENLHWRRFVTEANAAILALGLTGDAK